MTREHLAVASAVLTAVCVVPYLRDVVLGRTRPQRTSWFLFAFVSTVAFVSQLAAGGGAGVWLAGGSAVGFSAVFALSIGRGIGGWSPVDAVVLAIAVTGVVASVITGDALVAVVFVVVAELVAIALTVRKAVADPDSETASTWMIDAVAGVLATGAVTRFAATELLYPVHHTVVNAAVLVAIATGRNRRLVALAAVDVSGCGLTRSPGR